MLSPTARRVLWIDSLAGISAGVLVLALRHLAADLYAFPLGWVTVIACANVAYGTYSGSLAARATAGRAVSPSAVDVLIVGNAAWSLVCLGIAANRWPTASALGIGVVLLEAVIVGSLAVVEWRIVRPLVRARRFN